jgi:3-deoxy-D-manno-octulosonic-acid transferase
MLLHNRIGRGKEDPDRLAERRGFASRPRPEGCLIWIHAASVGESLAVLPLVATLLEKPDRSILVTTGTVTSAELMEQRLPARAFHQYVPLDLQSNVTRFFDHWRPDLALFVESELWPHLLLEAGHRAIPVALINARLSARSFAGWRRATGLAKRLFSIFDLCLAQDETIARRLSALGARNVKIAGNLKADAPPLPVEESTLSAVRQAIGKRPVFLAASTHDGEEALVLDAVNATSDPDALTVIVPRHSERGTSVESLAASRGFAVVRRRTGALPASDTEVYVADTMGELGLFYSIARVAFLGGSLIPHGGQNPLEAARFSVPVLAGPHTGNFAEAYCAIFSAQGTGLVSSARELAQLVANLLQDPAQAQCLGQRAKSAADGLGGALALTATVAEQMLANART